MDTTETYIKMADCEEIQSQRKRISPIDGKLYMYNEDGDWIANAKLVGLASMAVRSTPPIKNSPKLIWLPRQDQLQEMVGGFFYYQWNQFYKYLLDRDFVVGDLISDIHNGIEEKPITWEQLWLAFVMKEKYNKVWDGEKWY